MNYVSEYGAWFAGLLVFMSFCEHQIHRNLMHRKNFLIKYIGSLKKVFEHHAILHHGHYDEIFNDEPVARGQDHGIQLSIREGFLEALPVSALIATISLTGAVVLEIVVCLHHFLWNNLHLEMHKPDKRFFSDWPIYKFLARHHYLHHAYPNKNFNVVLPIADYVLGTHIRASQSDLNEMQRIGLL